MPETAPAAQAAPYTRIAVMGTGAVGGYFGGMLARAGQDVTFIARPKTAEVITKTRAIPRHSPVQGNDPSARYQRPFWC